MSHSLISIYVSRSFFRTAAPRNFTLEKSKGLKPVRGILTPGEKSLYVLKAQRVEYWLERSEKRVSPGEGSFKNSRAWQEMSMTKAGLG